MYACSLYVGSSNIFLLFKRESLDFEGLSLREKNFNFRESISLGRNDLLFPTLGMILLSLEMTFSPR